MSVQLGDRVKDKVSGLTGIATSVTIWLHGCVRVGVQPEGRTKDGKPRESFHFDEPQLEVMKKGVHTPAVMTEALIPKVERKTRPPGGPSREGSGFSR